jgi:spore germination cell wall hydrolase CwlJ-like protein
MTRKCLVYATFLTVAALLASDLGWAKPILDSRAIRAVVMEASGEGYIGMVAVAEAIRNRGSLKGVRGAYAYHYEPLWVWKQAEAAWKASANTNLVHGATHWENVKRFGLPRWARNMKVTAIIGRHYFFCC